MVQARPPHRHPLVADGQAGEGARLSVAFGFSLDTAFADALLRIRAAGRDALRPAFWTRFGVGEVEGPRARSIGTAIANGSLFRRAAMR